MKACRQATVTVTPSKQAFDSMEVSGRRNKSDILLFVVYEGTSDYSLLRLKAAQSAAIAVGSGRAVAPSSGPRPGRRIGGPVSVLNPSFAVVGTLMRAAKRMRQDRRPPRGRDLPSARGWQRRAADDIAPTYAGFGASETADPGGWRRVGRVVRGFDIPYDGQQRRRADRLRLYRLRHNRVGRD
jgi:hypothetical protein